MSDIMSPNKPLADYHGDGKATGGGTFDGVKVPDLPGRTPSPNAMQEKTFDNVPDSK